MSRDAGNTWIGSIQADLADSVNSFSFDLTDSSRVYAATDYFGVLRSLDGGISWHAARRGLEEVRPSCFLPCLNRRSIHKILVDSTDSEALLAASVDGLFESQNAGRTWTKVNSFPSEWVADVFTDPSNPLRRYATTTRVFRSDDGGQVWNSFEAGLPLSQTVRRLVVHPEDPTTVFAATDLGIYRSSDAGTSWSAANTGLPIRHPYSFSVTELTFDPSSAKTLYAGTWYQGMYKTSDGGESWTRLNIPPVDRVHSIAIHGSAPSRVYAGTSTGILRSEDGGGSWSQIFDLGSTPVIESTRPKDIRVGAMNFADQQGTGLEIFVKGRGFRPGYQIHWNGVPKETFFLGSCAGMMVRIRSEDLASEGSVLLEVVDPSSGVRSAPYRIFLNAARPVIERPAAPQHNPRTITRRRLGPA